ncbi:MAG: hypothetical protein JXQ75_07150 [Phycisphaerae bacterium]|nr:hypothetical protein [Phycisphaerae bacterium]
MMAFRNNEPRTRKRTGRRGYILIVVLGLTAVVATLGWAFLDAHSTIVPEAVNRLAAGRAQYVAESGIDFGTHFLMYPPTTVPKGTYWTGSSGIAVDETADYTDVVVVRDGTDPNLFTITAVGVAHDLDGSIRGKHTITAEVLVPPKPKWEIPYALYCGKKLEVPATATVHGDIFTVDKLKGSGWCDGNLFATGDIEWTGGGPPASINPNQQPFPAPLMQPSLYQTYNIRGTQYSAYSSWPHSNIFYWEADQLNAQDWSGTNPGRIIYINGDFELEAWVELHGTLVVNGKLSIDGPGIEVTAVDDYPALVVKDQIEFKSYNSGLTVIGSVLCGKEIKDGGKNVFMDVTGACMTQLKDGEHGFNTGGSNDTLRFNWDAGRSTFWDFARSADVLPITILSWKEN